MIQDIINMTPGQLLIKYWWLWVIIAVTGYCFLWLLNRGSRHKK